MPPSVRELREQMAQPAPERSDVPMIAFLGVAAFAIGAFAIMAWSYLSAPQSPLAAPQSPSAAAAKEPPAPTFHGKRLGHAGTAPLLRMCVNNTSLSEAFSGAEAEMILGIMKTADNASRLGSLLGAKGMDSGLLGEYWRELADCVYRQNSWNLCDIDNRALAVETASAFVRQKARSSGDASARERILGALRERVRNGLIIAADFGPLVPADIKRVLTETRPAANGCNR